MLYPIEQHGEIVVNIRTLTPVFLANGADSVNLFLTNQTIHPITIWSQDKASLLISSPPMRSPLYLRYLRYYTNISDHISNYNLFINLAREHTFEPHKYILYHEE